MTTVSFVRVKHSALPRHSTSGAAERVVLATRGGDPDDGSTR